MRTKIALLCWMRTDGTYSEDAIAEKLGFRGKWGASPAKRMYVWLKDRNLPDELVYPETPPDKGLPDRVADDASEKETYAERTERKPRATGEVKQLPSASRAKELFRKDLKKLSEFVDLLDRRREHLQGERFVLALLPDEEELDTDVISRSEFYRYSGKAPGGEFLEEEWKKVCESHGADPTVEEFMIRYKPAPSLYGAAVAPGEGLTNLIGVHALLRWGFFDYQMEYQMADEEPIPSKVERETFLDELIDALHPDPPSVDRKKLQEYADKLRVCAQNLAVTVRGGKVRTGRRPEEISRMEMYEALYVIGPTYTKRVSATNKSSKSLGDAAPWKRLIVW
jgi:hypothetical protein